MVLGRNHVEGVRVAVSIITVGIVDSVRVGVRGKPLVPRVRGTRQLPRLQRDIERNGGFRGGALRAEDVQ